jgi:hypothetical protein
MPKTLKQEYPITHMRIANANRILLRCAARLMADADMLAYVADSRFPSKAWKKQYIKDAIELGRLAMAARMDPD